MRITAAEYGGRSLVVLLGVSDYEDPDRNLRAPSRDVQRLYEVLTEESGCGIPQEQVYRLPGQGGAVLVAQAAALLKESVSRANATDILIIYFAGHGIRSGASFELCFTDGNLSAVSIDSILANVAARGVLLILDCCKSAGFAESAPQFFLNQPAHSEFRILLSASRANQPSWEFPDTTGTLFTHHLIETLAGREQAGNRPGVIRFTDLLRHLSDRLAEDLKSLHPGLAQEPVFAGTFRKDPLLFVHKGLTLSQVSLETSQYSRAYIRRLALKALFIGLSVFVFGTGTLAAYLDHLRFASADGNGITIYKGHPGIRLLGYPSPIWSLDFGGEAAKPSSMLRVKGGAIVSPLGQSVLPLLLDNLRPEYRALLEYREGKHRDALTDLRIFLQSSDFRSSDRAGAAVMLFGTLAEPADLEALENLTGDLRDDIRQNALLGILRLDRTRALLLAPGLIGQDSGFARTVMQNLSGNCEDATLSFLDAQLSSPNQAEIPDILDSALRLGCSFSTATLFRAVLKSISLPDRKDLAAYAQLTRGDELKNAAKEILAAGAGHVAPGQESAMANLIELTMFVAPTRECPDEVLSYRRNQFPIIAKRAYVAVISNCGKLRPMLTRELEESPGIRHDDQVLASLARSGVMEPEAIIAELLDRHNSGGILLVLDAIIESHERLSEKSARQLLEFQNESVRERTLIALRVSGAPSVPATKYFFDSSLNVQREAYRFYVQDHAKEAVTLLIDRMGDDSASYLPELLGTQKLTDDQRARVRKYLGGAGIERKNAAGTLIMACGQSEALELLTSNDFFIRNSAADYVGFRPDLAEIIARLKHDTHASEEPVLVSYIGAQLDKRNALQSELDRTPESMRPWRSELMTRANDAGSAAGLRIWLGSQVEASKEGRLQSTRYENGYRSLSVRHVGRS